MNIKYIGNARDYSGYGEAARHDIAALLTAGIDVTTTVPQFTLELADFGTVGEMVMQCENRDIPYDTVIYHLTPDIIPRYHEPDKRFIARVFWETDKLPRMWSDNIQKYADEVWTGSEYNRQALIKSGVTKPIYIVPQAIDTSVQRSDFEPYITASKGTYAFYSMFEWTERKNPLALLEAYWREFEHSDGVSLTIKTYVDNFTKGKRAEIDEAIRRLKAKLNLSHYAPLYLYRNLMDRHGIYRFHASFDCFVSAHRGEGWGLPQMEAALMGNPVISTNCGGIHEYLTAESAYLISYDMVHLSGNTRNMIWYTSDQMWAQINQDNLRGAMRNAFDYPEHVRIAGNKGREIIKEKLSFAAVGEIMKERLHA